MEKISSESMEVLLPQDSSGQKLVPPNDTILRKLMKQWISLAILALLLYDTILITLSMSDKVHERDLPYSPANSILKYERRRLWDGQPSIYAGKPSKEVDAAWEDLLTGVNVRVSKEEMILGQEEINNSTVQLLEGDYLGVLGVYHQLHCLDILRKAVHHSYYAVDATEEDVRHGYDTGHYDHCVERLRRSVMCHADLAMYSGEWIADSHEDESKILRSNGEIECVNWEAIDTWARGRALKRKEFKLRAGPFEHRYAAHNSLK